MGKLINTLEEIHEGKSVIVFDLDGTLAESKVGIDVEMGDLLIRLMANHKIAIIGGGNFEQLLSQLPVDILSANDVLNNLFLLPLNGGSFYAYKDGAWAMIYSQNLTDEEKNKILTAFESAFKDIDYIQPAKIYGEIIEDRGSQITFSALGQHAPLEEKEKWAKENNDKRLELEAKLKSILPEMEFQIAGLTSIDVTKKGIDKKYGIEQLIKYLGVTTEDVLFFGDAIEIDGNDYPALEAGVMCYRVDSIQDTKDALGHLLKLSSK
jgi:hypothetical protein